MLEQGRTLDDALAALPTAEPRDRAAAHRLAAAVLRHAGTLDAVLEPLLRRGPPAAVRTLLRMVAAELLLLGTPGHAAVDGIVALARQAGFTPFAALLNAVGRRLAEGGPGLLAELDRARLDTPAWLWASWGAQARAIAEAHAIEAPLDVTLLPGTPVLDGGTMLPTGSVRFPRGTPVGSIDGWAAGRVWVQDAAAAIPARLLDARPGEQVADLCAAPGGKTAQLAATGATVTAVERDPARTRLLAETLSRLGLAARLVTADALGWHADTKLDAVLVDAPCSATGTIRRHPDVPHLRRPRDVASLAAQQRRLLAQAAGLLRPGGRLLYAVCSLQPEEGAAVLDALAGTAMAPAPFSAAELEALPAAARTAAGWMRTHPALWPELGGMDGFFCARFVRSG